MVTPAALLVAVAAAGWFMIRMPGQSYRGRLLPLSAAETMLRDRLSSHVKHLAGAIGQRNVWTPGTLERATAYIEAEFRDAGYEPRRIPYECEGRAVWNIEAELPGSEADAGVIVVGAHYDTVPLSPGADDNASAVAGVLELARALREHRAPRTLRFLAFVNEEPPFFQTDAMGSLVYARICRARGDRIAAMVCLEMLGTFNDEAGSQHYPFPFSLLYPDRADFIGFIGNVRNRALVHRVIGSFRRHARFPSEGAALPSVITGVSWSDHWAFWKAGYPALMVTDTALFRNVRYHTEEDTPETLDYDRMTRVVAGLVPVVRELSTAP